ncbi:MAG: hypothetical protein B6U72_07530, partial [Candidatus Altiarchaeales archaeon ex4484_2]
MEELQQLNLKGYEIKTGVIQDASFVEADAGRKRVQREKKGRKIKYSDKQKQYMDRDGSFTAKNNQVHYGYKSHVKVDVDHHLIRDCEVTTAKTHDGDVDLVCEGDEAVYRDKGYFGKPLSARNVRDEAMKRATVIKRVH